MESGVEDGEGTRVDDHERRHVAVAAVVGGVAEDGDAGAGGGGSGRERGDEGGRAGPGREGAAAEAAEGCRSEERRVGKECV